MKLAHDKYIQEKITQNVLTRTGNNTLASKEVEALIKEISTIVSEQTATLVQKIVSNKAEILKMVDELSESVDEYFEDMQRSNQPININVSPNTSQVSNEEVIMTQMVKRILENL